MCSAINAATLFLAPTQKANLALLVSAVLKKRTLCLSELARAYPTPKKRRVPAPKHCLLHRLKQLWRFTDNERVDALEVQLAFACPTPSPAWATRASWGWPSTGRCSTPCCPPANGYATRFCASPSRARDVPCPCCSWPMTATACRPKGARISSSRTRLLAVVEALPHSVRPVVLADRGFCRAGFLTWLEYRGLDYVVRLSKGACTTEADGRRWKLGEEGPKPGQLRFHEGVHYGLYHGRPRELFVNVALCWRVYKDRAKDHRRGFPEEPWYLATSLKGARRAANWYWQRGWIEQSFKDSKRAASDSRGRRFAARSASAAS